MTDIDKLRANSESLQRRYPVAESTFFEIGKWLIEIGELQLKIAELLVKEKE